MLAQGGFQYGNDPLNNPQSDPTLVGTAVSSSVTPELFRLLKEYIGPEDETATGPNFPRQYKLRVDVANGQTLTNLQIRDILDSSMQFLKVDSVTGGAIASSSLPSITIPGGTLLETLASVTGSTGIDDATVTFSFYVPYFDSANLPTVPVTGQPQPAVDNAQAEGDWTPIDTRDAARHVVSASDSHTTHTLTERSLAIQKTVRIVDDQSSLGYTPGDTIEYTLHVQVSDYFAFQNLAVSDILPDGLSVDGSFTPTLELREHGVTSNLLFSGNTFSAVANPSSGTDLLVFNVSQLLQNNGQELVRAIEKNVSLAIIDQNWKEHLRDMDDLKQSVQNAVYEQKDPLLIYKFEGFEMFKRFVGKLNEDMTTFLTRADLPKQDPAQVQQAPQPQRASESRVQASKAEVGSTLNPGANRAAAAAASAGRPAPAPVAPRKVDKVYGRNDKVSVQYRDGSTKADVKYKSVEQDIEQGNCVVIES